MNIRTDSGHAYHSNFNNGSSSHLSRYVIHNEDECSEMKGVKQEALCDMFSDIKHEVWVTDWERTDECNVSFTQEFYHNSQTELSLSGLKPAFVYMNIHKRY